METSGSPDAPGPTPSTGGGAADPGPPGTTGPAGDPTVPIPPASPTAAGPPPIPPVPPVTPTAGGPAAPGAPGGSGAGASSAGLGLVEGDWPAQATDAIVDLVGTVRDKTTGPITTVARGLVFGLFAAVVGATIAILALIAVIRLLDEALPSGVWLPYLILGLVFVIAGAMVFRMRKAPADL